MKFTKKFLSNLNTANMNKIMLSTPQCVVHLKKFLPCHCSQISQPLTLITARPCKLIHYFNVKKGNHISTTERNIKCYQEHDVHCTVSAHEIFFN